MSSRKPSIRTNEYDVSFQNKQRWKEHKTKLALFILNLRLYSLCVQRQRRTNNMCVRAHRIERRRGGRVAQRERERERERRKER